MAKRRCARCPVLVDEGTRYCPACRAAYDAQRGTPEQRGYDLQHRRLRAQYRRRMASGERFTCSLCGLVVDPQQPWDLGHNDDRSGYDGPQHAADCNRADGGRRSRAWGAGAS